MNIPYSPQINPGLPAGGSAPLRPISLFSPKSIVSSSQPIRNQVAETQIKSNELEQEINAWLIQDANNPLYKLS